MIKNLISLFGTCCLILLVAGNGAYAKNIDLSNFKSSCPALSNHLLSVEKKLNKLRLSDKNFLRYQVESFTKISRQKVSGQACKEAVLFFEKQASISRTALRNRAKTSAARAQQMQAQLAKFRADMDAAHAVLSAIASAANSQQGNSSSSQSTSTNSEGGCEYWHGNPRHGHEGPRHLGCDIGHLH